MGAMYIPSIFKVRATFKVPKVHNSISIYPFQSRIYRNEGSIGGPERAGISPEVSLIAD